MSGRMHWAMYAISCCGMPELLMSFFRRDKLRNDPPVCYEIYKVQVRMCERVWIGRGSPFYVLLIQIAGWLMSVPLSDKYR